MKKTTLLTLALAFVGLVSSMGCGRQGGSSDQYNTQMGTNSASQQRSQSATSTNKNIPPSTP